jgi:hypothetical protein
MFDPADPARMALDGMESYCAAHPDSPSALRRPNLSFRNGLWIALLGPSVGEGIVGLGDSVEAALRAFDAQYNIRLRPPSAVEERLATPNESSSDAFDNSVIKRKSA